MRPISTKRERAISTLAGRQHGVVAHGQLVKMGFGPEAIQRRLRAGRLHRVHRGVYAVGHSRLSWHGRLMAAVLAAGPGALLSHRSAATLWGLRPTKGRRVDVIALGSARPPGICIHRTRVLTVADRATHDGIPVTSVARTLLDYAEVVKLRELELAVDEAERRGLFNLRAVKELVSRSHGRRGVKPLNALIANAADPPASRSELEHRFAAFCRDAALPQPATNVLVAGYEVDAAWIKEKVVVELDSWAFHGGRSAFESDRARDRALQLAHYRVVRITWRALQRDPRKLEEDLRLLLASAA